VAGRQVSTNAPYPDSQFFIPNGETPVWIIDKPGSDQYFMSTGNSKILIYNINDQNPESEILIS